MTFGQTQKSTPKIYTFRRKLLFQMAVEWWEMNLETCYGYAKHSSGSGQYVSKKSRVIRRVEVKILQEIDEKVEKELLKKGSLHMTVQPVPTAQRGVPIQP